MKKSLTFHYTLQQIAFWAAAAGVVSFASAFLLEKGFAASQVGVLLACGNLLSCAVQPVLADRADRAGPKLINLFIIGLTGICMLCFLILLLVPLSTVVFGLLYLTAVFTFDSMLPLLNALCVAYTRENYSINYGVGRGVGSFAFSLAALGIGRVIADFGADWMLWIALVLLAANIVTTLAYPRLSGNGGRENSVSDCCSIPVFFTRYKWYCISLLGVMLLAMFHSMTENYMIKLMEKLGGDSGSVGVALFVATAIEMVVLLYLEKIRKFARDNTLFKIAGLSFVLKAVLLLVAPSVKSIYFIQLLQATSYTFLAPVQLYYANNKVSHDDMVKGQAFISASYTLGCAAGNFMGGQLVEALGVTAMLIAGVIIAVAGTAILFMTVEKNDKAVGIVNM